MITQIKPKPKLQAFIKACSKLATSLQEKLAASSELEPCGKLAQAYNC